MGHWDAQVTIRLASGVVKRDDDFKYLGSWLIDSTKDFNVRKALAWKACLRLVKIWKSSKISRRLKFTLFRA